MDKHGKAKKSALPLVAVAVAAVAIIILAIVFIGPMLQQQGGPMLGSDRDAHGCIASAGYTWCEPLQQCIREWETNCTAGSPMGDNIAVAEPPKPDSNGCMPSDGYTWCEDKHKCLRVWEEDCPTLQAIDEQVRQQAQRAIAPTGPADNVTAIANGTEPTGSTPPAENGTAPLLGGDRDEHGCIGSAGYTWCEPLQKCIRPWEENCTAAE